MDNLFYAIILPTTAYFFALETPATFFYPFDQFIFDM